MFFGDTRSSPVLYNMNIYTPCAIDDDNGQLIRKIAVFHLYPYQIAYLHIVKKFMKFVKLYEVC